MSNFDIEDRIKIKSYEQIHKVLTAKGYVLEDVEKNPFGESFAKCYHPKGINKSYFSAANLKRICGRYFTIGSLSRRSECHEFEKSQWFNLKGIGMCIPEEWVEPKMFEKLNKLLNT